MTNEHLPKHHKVLPVLVVVGSIIGVALIIFLIWFFGHPKGSEEPNTANVNEFTDPVPANSDTSNMNVDTTPAVSWSYNGTTWKYLGSGDAPTCPSPLLESPVDLTQVQSILYPGQTRNLYKPHGGFIMKDNDVNVSAPMDAIITRGSRYIEQGEVQYLFEFLNSCGILYRFDHLLTLAPVLQKLADSLPAAAKDDSRTTNFDGSTRVETGDLLATAIGNTSQSNSGFDFGVYDLRSANEASKSSSFQAAHASLKELTFFGSCWLDLLPPTDSVTVKALPAGDGKSGKTSDYCK